MQALSGLRMIDLWRILAANLQAAWRILAQAERVEMLRTIEQILFGSRLLPYTEQETRVDMDAVNIRRKKGGDLSIEHPKFCAGTPNILAAPKGGILFFFRQSIWRQRLLSRSLMQAAACWAGRSLYLQATQQATLIMTNEK